VVWNIAAQHPDKTAGVASLCVPYIAQGFTIENRLPLVDRSVYPADLYPAGQWDYHLFYEENFDKARADFEVNIRNVVKAMFRRGDPARVGKPAPTASVRKAGGWFGGGACPDVPRDGDVITEQDLEAYTAALQASGFFGPNSWYMNHKANGAYARRARNGGKLSMPVLFLHGAYDTTCETVSSKLAEPMRRDCSDLTEVVVKSGHWMAQEQPAAVNAALAKWLATKLPEYWSLA
jgi:pimeloyl-ACP methyl ester carboxylesterase